MNDEVKVLTPYEKAIKAVHDDCVELMVKHRGSKVRIDFQLPDDTYYTVTVSKMP